jgi:hypothetical protein
VPLVAQNAKKPFKKRDSANWGIRVNQLAGISERARCPRCDSHELFFNAQGAPSICVVCFHVIKTGEQTAAPKFSWVRGAIAVGVIAGVIACLTFATSAAYEWYVARYESASASSIGNMAMRVAQSKRADHFKDTQLGDGTGMFGNKPWYKGFIDRADSCALMPPSLNPKEDVENDGAHAYISHADSHGSEYALTYTDGFRTWVYASSEMECRRVINQSIWHRTVDAAGGAG